MNSFGSLGNFGLSSSLEKSISVDDLVGGIFRLSGQAGLHRSESEAAFQEFLKKIPSATNLAALGVAAQQAQADLSNDTSAAVEGAANLMNMGLPNGSGIPRVPSLDFLRALVVNQQHPGLQGKQPPSPLSLPIASLGSLSAGMNLPGLGFGPQSYMHGQNAAVAAAAMKLHNLSQGVNSQQGATSSPPASSDGCRSGGGLDDKAEARRARRMLSNRESARRSRRRKQEMMTKLESELNQVADSKKEIADKVDQLNRRLASAEDDNRRLKEENARLKDELGFLRTEISERKVLRWEESADEKAAKKPKADGN